MRAGSLPIHPGWVGPARSRAREHVLGADASEVARSAGSRLSSEAAVGLALAYAESRSR